MPEAEHSSPAPYASSDDFRRIFYEENDSLHRLSFLLTADREKAEQCFVSGLEESVNGISVFEEWALFRSGLFCAFGLRPAGRDCSANLRGRANRNAIDFRLERKVNGETLNRASTGDLR
jgi:hypothetical protein